MDQGGAQDDKLSIKVHGIIWRKMNFLSQGLSVFLIISCRKSQSTCLILTSLSHRSISQREKRLWQVVRAKFLQLCLTLCSPIDWSAAASAVHGTLQAGILEWVAVSSSRESSLPRDRTHISCLMHWQAGSLPLAPPFRIF